MTGLRFALGELVLGWPVLGKLVVGRVLGRLEHGKLVLGRLVLDRLVLGRLVLGRLGFESKRCDSKIVLGRLVLALSWPPAENLLLFRSSSCTLAWKRPRMSLAQGRGWQRLLVQKL